MRRSGDRLGRSVGDQATPTVPIVDASIGCAGRRDGRAVHGGRRGDIQLVHVLTDLLLLAGSKRLIAELSVVLADRRRRLVVYHLGHGNVTALEHLAVILQLAICLLLLQRMLMVLLKRVLELVSEIADRGLRVLVVVMPVRGQVRVGLAELGARVVLQDAITSRSARVLVLLHCVPDRSVWSDVDRVAVPRIYHVPCGQPRSLLLVRKLLVAQSDVGATPRGVLRTARLLDGL